MKTSNDMRKWEYKILYKDKSFTEVERLNTQHEMDQLGIGGWEVIAIEPNYVYFKREILSDNQKGDE